MKKLFTLLAFAGALLAGACSDDDNTPASWKQLPQEPVTGEDLALTINGEVSPVGTVQLSVNDAKSGVLTLTSVVAGYPEVTVPVTLAETTEGVFSFTGSTGVSAPTVTRATDEPVFNIETSGTITPAGTVSAKVSTALTTAGQGGLVGSWPLSKDDIAYKDPDTWEQIINETSALRLKWVSKDAEAWNGEGISNLVTLFGTHILSEVLNNITLSADGNLTASYYPGLITSKMRNPDTGEWVNTQEYMEENGATEMFDETTYWIFSRISIYKPDPYQREWLTSPKNLVTWYVSGGYIYLLPNLPQILKQVTADGNADIDPAAILEMIQNFREMDDASLKQTLSMLGSALGIDLSGLDVSLVRTVFGWLEAGIPLKYSHENGVVHLYIDKAMADPFMEFLLTLMPLVDTKFDEMAAENQMLGMVKYMLGIEKFTDFQTIWNSNTELFELGLNFKPAATPSAAHKAPRTTLVPNAWSRSLEKYGIR